MREGEREREKYFRGWNVASYFHIASSTKFVFLQTFSLSLSLSFSLFCHFFFSLFLLSCNVSCFKSPNLSKGILLKFEKLSNKKPKYIKFCTYFVYSYKWFLVFFSYWLKSLNTTGLEPTNKFLEKVPNCLDPTNQMTW